MSTSSEIAEGQCREFPPDVAEDTTYFITNVIFMPLLFGIGFLGNLLAVVVLNRRYLRIQSPIYVYLTALSIVDILGLVMIAPSCLRDLNILEVYLSYSKGMTLATTYAVVARKIFHHCSIWIVAFLLIVRYIEIRPDSKKRRIVHISTARILSFVIFMFCALVNFAGFFEVEVVEVIDHCFSDLHLWTWQLSEFGKAMVTKKIYSIITMASCYLLPYFIILVMSVLLMGRSRVHNVKSLRLSLDRNEVETNLMVLVVTLCFFLAKLPELVMVVMRCFSPKEITSTEFFKDFALVADLLLCLPAALNILLYLGISSDIRTTFRRAFCCVCLTGDDYIEPFSLSNCCKPNQTQQEIKGEKKSRAKSPTRSGSNKSSQSQKPLLKARTGYNTPQYSTDGSTASSNSGSVARNHDRILYHHDDNHIYEKMPTAKAVYDKKSGWV